jgi:hypothetical protein
MCSINPWEVEKPVVYRISQKRKQIKYTYSRQQADRLGQINNHVSEFMNDYMEFKCYYLNINASRYK